MNPMRFADRAAAPALPAWALRARDRVAALVVRLPIEPPSFVLARGLDRALLPRLPRDARDALSERSVEVVVADLGLRVRLQLVAAGFRVAPARSATVLRIVAPASSYLRLIRGEEDAGHERQGIAEEAALRRRVRPQDTSHPPGSPPWL